MIPQPDWEDGTMICIIVEAPPVGEDPLQKADPPADAKPPVGC